MKVNFVAAITISSFVVGGGVTVYLYSKYVQYMIERAARKIEKQRKRKFFLNMLFGISLVVASIPTIFYLRIAYLSFKSKLNRIWY
jgi:hypothetical protein